MRILLTGATGFLGGHLTKHLYEKNTHSVLALTRRHIPQELRFKQQDELLVATFKEAEIEESLKGQEFDAIVHCAAISQANVCEENPELAREINSHLSRQLARIAQDRNVPLCHISTDLVFDGCIAPESGFIEEDKPSPVSIYANTKHDAELLVHELNPNALILRTSLLFGEPVGEKSGFLGWISAGLKGGKQISLFEDEWRTPVYVQDVCRVILQGIEEGLRGIYHCAGPQSLTRYEFGLLYANHFELDETLIIKAKRADVPSVPVRPKNVSLCSEKLIHDFAVSPRAPTEAFVDFHSL